MYLSDKYNYIARDDITLFVEQSFESVFVEVFVNNMVNIIVGEIYRVPNSNRQLSIQYYEIIRNKLQYENKEVILGTDQNFDHLNPTCAHTKNLLKTYFYAGFIPTITRPTRITQNNLCAPLKTVTISHKHVIREKWMAKGLLKSSHNLNKLRSKISMNKNNVAVNKYKTYRNLYNRLICIAQTTH